MASEVDSNDTTAKESAVADALELTDIDWVGETVAPKLATIGIDSPEDLLYTDKHRIASLDRLGIKKAEMIIQAAHDAFEARWDDKQFDPQTQTYYDAGPSSYDCVCGRSFDEEPTFNVHVKRCTTAGGAPPRYRDFSVTISDDGYAEVYGDGDQQSGHPAIGFSPEQAEALAEFLFMHYDLDHLLPEPETPQTDEPSTDGSDLSSP